MSHWLRLTDKDLVKEACYIDGKWVPAAADQALTVVNPASGARLGQVPALGKAETEQAIDAAAAAFDHWRKVGSKERSQILRRWFDLIMSHQQDLALILTQEQGKPLAEAENEIAYAASYVEWFAEEAKRIYGDTLPVTQADKRILVLKQPVGVCAAITPWNFPAAMVTRKVAPALAAGCTLVLKPAPQTPFTAIALVALAERAGIPAGVINLVTGPAEEIGQALTSSPKVRQLSFTGSTAVGKKLLAACADTVKRVSMELGGHAPFIVFDDADVELAVSEAMKSKFRNTGQACVCANRFYVQRDIYEAFSQQLAEAVAAQLCVGDGLDARSTQGPLIDQAAVAKVTRQVDDAVTRGAQVMVGGNNEQREQGYYYLPTVLTNVDASMMVTQEETFGPIAPVIPFDTEDELIAQANDTRYGLAAYLFTESISRVSRVSEALEYGMVGVNTGLLSSELVPFGGVKESGIGREGSKYGIDEYLEMKCLSIGNLL